MKIKKCRSWCCAISSVVVVVTTFKVAAVDIVHRANVDLMLNASQSNPYTNVHDGVWSYLRTKDGGVSGERILLANQHLRMPFRGVGSGLVGASDTGPGWILVNARGTNSVNGTINGGVPVPGGALLMHPGSAHRTVLRFTAPRDGRYAACGYVDATMTRQAGKIAGDVLVNGSSVWNATIIRAPTNADRSSEKVGFTTADHELAAGDTMELVIGNSDGYAGDCTGVGFDVTEKDTSAVFLDPVAAITNNFQNGVPAQPFRGLSGEYWSLLSATNLSGMACSLLSVFQPDSDKYSGVQSAFRGARGSSDAFGGYYCRVQALFLDTFAYHADGEDREAVAPGELWMHTGALADPRFASVLRFQPGSAGVYAFNVNVRDMNVNGDGVTVYVRASGRILAETSVLLTASGGSAGGQIRVPPMFLVGTEPVDVLVHPRANIGGDGTAVMVAVKKVCGEPPEGWHDFNADVFPSLSSENGAAMANPVVCSDGASWGFGQYGDMTGTYSALTGKSTWTKSSYGEVGWTVTGEPFVFQNVAQNMKQPYPGGANSGVLYALPGEVNMRGGTSTCAVVRFTAPTDGVYSVKASFRHLYSGKVGSYAAVRTGGWYYPAATGRIYHAPTGYNVEMLDPDEIYLHAGEHLELAVRSGEGHKEGSGDDITGTFAAVRRSEVPSGRIVSVDFDGTSANEAAVPYRGCGRLGFADEQFWNACRVEDGAVRAKSAALWFSDESRQSNVRLEISSSRASLAAAAPGANENALLGDGVVSRGSDEKVTVTLSGLKPEGSYDLVLYGDGVNLGTVALGETVAETTRSWFAPQGRDLAVITGVADERGRMSVTFASAASDCETRFSGLQIRGAEFPDYIPDGTLVIFR